MKKILAITFATISLSMLLSSCGISKEIRTASTSLVTKQKASLDAHIAFHKATLSTLNSILDAEQLKSDKDYKDAISNYHQAMLDELKNIYENNSLSEADKKVKEEEARQTILALIQEAEDNKKKREGFISGAKGNLVEASNSLLEGEQAKSDAIKQIDVYLQAKRPSERLLEMINLDLDKYSGYVKQANDAIKKAEPFIDKLK